MKKRKSHKEWANSIEGIHYSLQSIGPATVEDEQNNILIAQVLFKLPKGVRERVLEEVIFVHTTAYGTVQRLLFQEFIEEKDAEKIKGERLIKSGFLVTIQKVFIILNFKCIRKNETKRDTIAHEIAHFILSSENPCGSRSSDKEERESDDLAEKWGFKRSYKSYKQFKEGVSSID